MARSKMDLLFDNNASVTRIAPVYGMMLAIVYTRTCLLQKHKHMGVKQQLNLPQGLGSLLGPEIGVILVNLMLIL